MVRDPGDAPGDHCEEQGPWPGAPFPLFRTPSRRI
jgi:hypothetical protein